MTCHPRRLTRVDVVLILVCVALIGLTGYLNSCATKKASVEADPEAITLEPAVMPIPCPKGEQWVQLKGPNSFGARCEPTPIKVEVVTPTPGLPPNFRIPHDMSTVNCECARRLVEYLYRPEYQDQSPEVLFSACPELVGR